MRNFLRLLSMASVMVSLTAFSGDICAQVRRTNTDSENTTKVKRSNSGTTRSTGNSSHSSSQVRRTQGSSTTNSGSQVRRTSGNSSSNSSGQVRRTEQKRRSEGTATRTNSSSSSQVRRTQGSSTRTEYEYHNGQIRRVSGNSSSSSSSIRNGESSTRGQVSNGNVRPGSNSRDGRVIRSNTNVTRNGLGHYDGSSNTGSGYYRDDNFYIRDDRYDDDYYDYRIHDHNLYRIPPIERDYMRYERISHFYGPENHYFGWRVASLPPMYSRVTYYGIEYYTYRNVYYRRYRGHYVVCRPPVGITVEASVGRRGFLSVRFSYYPSQYRTYRGYDSYSRYIDRQNRIIAENNAIIASQNRMIALNSASAHSSYDIANALGLVQSYAYADREYFYQDGVFYILNSRGRYEVIVPPAGALVERLPEDYDIITLRGAEYYRVDDTVYRTVLVYGVPQLEVLGQMYGKMARKYNRYYDDRDYDYDYDDDWNDYDD